MHTATTTAGIPTPTRRRRRGTSTTRAPLDARLATPSFLDPRLRPSFVRSASRPVRSTLSPPPPNLFLSLQLASSYISLASCIPCLFPSLISSRPVARSTALSLPPSTRYAIQPSRRTFSYHAVVSQPPAEENDRWPMASEKLFRYDRNLRTRPAESESLRGIPTCRTGVRERCSHIRTLPPSDRREYRLFLVPRVSFPV